MIFIKDYDLTKNVIEPKINFEICDLWTRCLMSLKEIDGQVDCRFNET